ncbi:MAG: peptidase M28, partial [Planctomycetota bacterium]
NASAVAVLIEMARLLRESPPRPTVRLVAYANQEPPHFGSNRMGSYAHANMLRREAETTGLKIHGMLCLEMLGYYLTEPNSQPYPRGVRRWLGWALPGRGNFIALVSSMRSAWFMHRLRWAMGVRSGRGALPRVPMWAIALPPSVTGGATMLSDHYQYELAGFPSAMATDTAFVRNPHYHQRSDLPDTLDYERMATTTLRLTRAVRRFR